MRKIIGGKESRYPGLEPICLVGSIVPDCWDVSLFEVNGHREVSVRPVIQWHEDPDWSPPREHPDWPGLKTVAELEEIEAKRLRSLEKNAKRAATQCRRSIKAAGFDTMLTITYRENQTDRGLCKKHFKEWVRRMRRSLPDFQYVAAFEAQERGAMHVHVATHKLPKHSLYKGVKIEAWKLGTKVWRSIVGDNNGLVFVGGKTKWGKGFIKKMSLAKMAAYVSKYITKDYATCPGGSNRYSKSDNLNPPEPEKIRLTGYPMRDVIELLFECPDGYEVVSHRFGFFKDSYWLCTEPTPG